MRPALRLFALCVFGPFLGGCALFPAMPAALVPVDAGLSTAPYEAMSCFKLAKTDEKLGQDLHYYGAKQDDQALTEWGWAAVAAVLSARHPESLGKKKVLETQAQADGEVLKVVATKTTLEFGKLFSWKAVGIGMGVEAFDTVDYTERVSDLKSERVAVRKVLHGRDCPEDSVERYYGRQEHYWPRAD